MMHPTRLPIYRFKDDYEHTEILIKEGISMRSNYAVMGEVANTRRYILLDITNGRTLPGTWCLECFRPATEDEICNESM